MARNRKRDADAVRLRQMTKIVLLACACAAVGLGYVWQKKQIYRLGRELKQREIAVEDTKRRNMGLEAQAAQLKSPAVLEARVRAMNLKLVTPTSSQVVRLTASPTPQPAPTVTPVRAINTNTNRPRIASNAPAKQARKTQ
jgi:hypothetical protein